MSPQLYFFASIGFSLIAWSIVVSRYIWPRLRLLPGRVALRPILVLNTFRFIGLAFLVPGVVSPDLPSTFARHAAYGDIIAVALALLSLAAPAGAVGTGIVWIFNLWGTADLLNAFYQAALAGLVPGQLGAAYFYSHTDSTAVPDHSRSRVPPPSAERERAPHPASTSGTSSSVTVASAIACVIVPGAVIPPSAMVVPEGGETAALPCRDFAVRLAGAGRHAHFRGERQAHISRRARGTAVAAGYTRYDEPSNNECAEPAARSAPSITGVHEMPPPIDWS